MGKRAIFFAQDEGSAKALVPVILRMIGQNAAGHAAWASGHAARIFGERGIPFTITDRSGVGEAFSPRPDLVVTGASMRASIEKEAIRIARRNGVPSVTLLDSPLWPWCRFTVDGAKDAEALSDHILVLDPECRKRMISEGFPAGRLMTTGNPHFDALPVLSGSRREKASWDVLVVTQPEFRDGRYESDLPWLETVISLCQRLDNGLTMTVRPHGKEDRRLHDPFSSPGCRVDAESDILDLIEAHRLIVGKNSSTLLEAALLGKGVISYSLKEVDLLQSPIEEWGLFRKAIDHGELEVLLRQEIQEKVRRPVPRDIPFYTDGRNGERVIDILQRILKG